MNTIEAVGVLTKSLYRERNNWLGKNEGVYVISLADCRCETGAECQCQNYIFTNFEAIAIAEKLLKDPELGKTEHLPVLSFPRVKEGGEYK